jgi:hypothetical protein
VTSPSGLTIWQLVAEAARTLPEPFSRQAIISWVSERRADVELSSISTHIAYATAETPNRERHPLGARPPLLERVDRGLYRRHLGATPTMSAAPVHVPAGTSSPPTAGQPTTGDIVLVGCSRTKSAVPAPAEDLFQGPGFRRARAYAAASGAPWFVLSAKYGLLTPDDVVGPYDVYLPDRSSAYRAAWGEWVVSQLAERQVLHGARVEVHASQAYTAPLREPLRRRGATLHEPLAGLRQGERLAWYGPAQPESLSAGVPDVSPLLDERTAVPPARFLSDGRVAAARPGLYSWWVDQTGAHELSAGLGHRVSRGLIYAGRAGGVRSSGKASANTLWGRVGEMHLGGSRQFSTFRLTLAAALSPQSGPVIDEGAVTAWMHQHLRVAVLPLPPEAVSAGEDELLRLADPPLNLRDVAASELRRSLSRRRSALTAASKGTA